MSEWDTHVPCPQGCDRTLEVRVVAATENRVMHFYSCSECRSEGEWFRLARELHPGRRDQ